MARKPKRGIQIFNKFILKEKFTNNIDFEKEVQKTYAHIKLAWCSIKTLELAVLLCIEISMVQELLHIIYQIQNSKKPW